MKSKPKSYSSKIVESLQKDLKDKIEKLKSDENFISKMHEKESKS